MARALPKIEQELKTLSEQAEEVKQELHDRYVRYLEILGRSLKKHLPMVTYYICTQTYPDLFLNLSVRERQELQEKIREICNDGTKELTSALERAETLKLPSPSKDIRETILKKLPITEEQLKMLRERLFQSVKEEEAKTTKNDANTQEKQSKRSLNIFEEDDDNEEILEIKDDEDINDEDINDEDINDEDINEEDINDKSEDENQTQDPDHPIHLANFLKRVEKVLNDLLQDLSNRTNQLLQSSGILSTKFPPQVLEAAIEAEGSGSAVGNSPNTLNLLIEAENAKSSKDSTVMQVTAVRLRLGEIEFSEPALSAQRNRIRELGSKIKKLCKYYDKLKREKAISEAEIAWRSTWYEE
ncbi:MAG: hypothetical protein J7647_11975 [Cyanobacteria bacterium SBLK]|nr:hypothetical protein [Cyanobacteria bacterium SBLK]